MVRDLETGSVYGPYHLFTPQWTSFGQPAPLTSEVTKNHTLRYHLTGRVLACRLATRQI